MPHFIIDCSENILTLCPAKDILQAVHTAAVSADLFNEIDIKVRIRSFQNTIVGNADTDFIHVFGNIMEGRTTAQKASLSQAVVTCLKDLLPEVPVISINIREFEKATYFNRDML